ncbi:hypothetical protein CONCODRAFT_87771, partial [Conidiobolus coronatus NRRL 28638]
MSENNNTNANKGITNTDQTSSLSPAPLTNTNAAETNANTSSMSEDIPLSQVQSQLQQQESSSPHMLQVMNEEAPPSYSEIHMNSVRITDVDNNISSRDASNTNNNNTRDMETGSDYGVGYNDGVSCCNISTMDCFCLVHLCECMVYGLALGLCGGG